ncbi:hypothetical protein RHGRI_028175 [Rhododendron griersonianum]|uniref:Uncharacterized protein n=1 Tax=Rhododendron griersonianum TaxID=479676 RepID=A0AAV6IFE4_9ERIC|nr:hypothetical protein RHGRI_028175 [Rhododendron griersonianum]
MSKLSPDCPLGAVSFVQEMGLVSINWDLVSEYFRTEESREDYAKFRRSLMENFSSLALSAIMENEVPFGWYANDELRTLETYYFIASLRSSRHKREINCCSMLPLLVKCSKRFYRNGKVFLLLLEVKSIVITLYACPLCDLAFELRELKRIHSYYAYAKSLSKCDFIKLDSDFEEIFQRLKSENRWPELSDDFLRALLENHFSILHEVNDNSSVMDVSAGNRLEENRLLEAINKRYAKEFGDTTKNYEELWINEYFVPHMKYKSMVQKNLDQARVLRTEHIPLESHLTTQKRFELKNRALVAKGWIVEKLSQMKGRAGGQYRGSGTGRVPGLLLVFASLTAGWRGSTLVTYEAPGKPLFENFSPGLKHSDGPMTLPCSLSRFQNDHKVLSTCEKVMKMGHPYVLRLESVLKDGDLVTVHERLPVTLLDHFKGNMEDFLIGHNRDYVYVAPLFQRLLRELILAFKEFHEIGLMLLPSLSCLYVYTGSEGTISLKISLLQCQSYSPPNDSSSSPDYLALYCGTVMKTLIQPHVAKVPELEDFITRASIGRWWSNTSDLFRHPLFWSSAMHMDFLESMNIHLHQTTRPTPNPLNPKNQQQDGLGDLATEMGKAWRVVPKLWPDSPVGAWMNLCKFPVPARWSDIKYKHLPLYRQARNLIQHHSEAHFYGFSGPWGCRRDLFLHKLNMTYNLTIVLFQVFEKILLVKLNNGVQGKDERARSDMVEDPAIESPCLPPGKPVRLKLPVEIVGDVLQHIVPSSTESGVAVTVENPDAFMGMKTEDTKEATETKMESDTYCRWKGDGGVLRGALTAVVGIEADALILSYNYYRTFVVNEWFDTVVDAEIKTHTAYVLTVEFFKYIGQVDTMVSITEAAGRGRTRADELTWVSVQLLAQAMKNIFGCLSKENDMLSTDDGGSDATGACESIALSDETILDWAQLLESVIKLPTIVGARMQKCVNDVLEKGPAEWAKKILAHSTIDLRLAVGAYGGSHDAFLEDVREDLAFELRELKRIHSYYAYAKSLSKCDFIKLDSDFEEIFQRLKSENRWPELSDDFLRALLENHFSILHEVNDNSSVMDVSAGNRLEENRLLEAINKRYAKEFGDTTKNYEELWINEYFVPHMKYKSMVQKNLDQARVLRTEYIPLESHLTTQKRFELKNRALVAKGWIVEKLSQMKGRAGGQYRGPGTGRVPGLLLVFASLTAVGIGKKHVA